MKKYTVIVPGPLVFSTGTDKDKKEYTGKKGDNLQLPQNDRAVKVLLSRKQIVEVPTAKDSPKE